MFDEDTDDLLVYLFLICAALAGGPSMLGAFGLDAGSWLVNHHVLVPPEDSVVVLPLVEAGVDHRRAVILGLVLVVGLIAGFARVVRGVRASR